MSNFIFCTVTSTVKQSTKLRILMSDLKRWSRCAESACGRRRVVA